MESYYSQKCKTGHYFDIDMLYMPGRNNFETGQNRRDFSLKVCGRFNLIAPVLIKRIYNINHRLALLHLNKLVDEGYLVLYKTPRAVDGRVYVFTYSGANYASELLSTSLQFRSQSNPSLLVNHNTISHDLMNAYVLLIGVNNYDKHGEHQPLWDGFVSEREFARIYASNEIRNVDGIVRENNKDQSIAAIEIESSYKNKGTRKTILLKLLHSLQADIYEKVFMVSQRQAIFDDIKRFHDQLFQELTQQRKRKASDQCLTEEDVQMLKDNIIFRTKFCEELQTKFYR